MKKAKGIICILLTSVLIILTFSGCSGNKRINFIYPFSGDVRSYDPQVAATTDEYMIIENTFEGLIRIDDDGTVKKGVADSWEISNDGLTYTFHIKRGLKWDIDTEKNKAGEYKDKRLVMLGREFNPDITAADFVFALRRAAQPETECPMFTSISAIKNANAVHSRKIGATALGVKATDTYTLVITLARADDGFLQTMASAVAMPCNEEFFNATKGRYGLSTKYTLFNGQYYVDQILESSYLLKKNKFYGGENPAVANELTLKIPAETETASDTLKKLESGYYDAAFIHGDESEKLKGIDNLSYTPYTNITWAFVLNTKDEIMQSKTMRKAFCQGFTRLNDTGKEYLSPATTLTPNSCTFGTENAAKTMGKTVINENQSESISNWQKAVKILGRTEIEITVITSEYMKPYVKQMLQGIQGGLGASLKTSSGDKIDLTIKVEGMTDAELKSAVCNKNYMIAFYPFETNASSALSFLQSVAEENPSGFGTTNMTNSITNAGKESATDKIAEHARRAEKAAILSYSICPMLYETSYYVAAKGVKGVQFHPGTGRISFVNATRKD